MAAELVGGALLSATFGVLFDRLSRSKSQIKQWLDELKDAPYDADDLLDDIATYALQSKMEVGSRTKSKRIYVLGLINGIGEKPSSRQPTTSLIEEFEVYGRHGDKEALTKLLVMDDEGSNKVSVIPIVGMGYVGKTTLAESVYNDDKVNKQFKLK
ncbi:putative disease resistance RPP13-like protein 1 [Ziziphus jujuba]|uniref:Disease resistance RPP13-like protein 1 n=1 Tax=Ziziphus jujuba TaxID=326968 RepID=A0ABM3ZYC6_ZIZJJ|nr:putative disease resistance RPP13-like protein 1 [Ziziphus jujuba]